jgi:osmotically-inducible protein OsmY
VSGKFRTYLPLRPTAEAPAETDLDDQRNARIGRDRCEYNVPMAEEDQTMKGDSQLRQDVLNELMWDPSLSEKAIGVGVKDGVVTLGGFVDDWAQKRNAERAAERVIGVRGVVDEVNVKLLESMARKDEDIAQAAIRTFQWDIEIPDTVKVKVEQGWLTLEGEARWQYQKSAADRAVRNLKGVRGVTNLIAIKPPAVSSFDVSTKIKEALRRAAEEDAEHVIVDAADGRVTLSGRVRTFAEREEAERAAWSAPGVRKVEDRILVGL